MRDPAIRIVQLEPARVASAWAFGPSPERLAWQKLAAWAQSRGLLAEVVGRRIFGFNNPNPSQGSPNYGYEYWLTVEPSVMPEGDIRLVDFPGGLYAAMSFDLAGGDPGEVIPASWRRLDAWVAESQYQPAHHQWLEGHSMQGEPQELYYPVRAR